MKLVLILLLNGCIAQGGNGDIIFDSS
ncbi:MAG: hypothetical protein ACI848_000663, partial [Roseivirga sp.]